MKWKDLKLFAKLIIAFSITISFSVIIGLIAITSLNTINKNTRKQLEYHLPAVNNVYKMDKNWHEVLYYLNGFDYTSSEYFKQKVILREERTRSALESLEKNADSANLASLDIEKIKSVKLQIEKFEQLFNNYAAKSIETTNAANNLLQLADNSKVTNGSVDGQLQKINQIINHIRLDRNIGLINELEAVNLSSYSENVNDLTVKFKDNFIQARSLELETKELGLNILGSVMSFSDTGLDSFIENTEKTGSISVNSNFIMIIIIVLIVFIGIAFSILISQSIRKPIIESVKFAQQMSNGNLGLAFEIDRKDEMGELMNALGVLAKTNNQIISKIKESAKEISDASIDLNNKAQEMANGATEQASSVEEIAASMVQMSANIEQNSKNATETEKIAKSSANDIVDGTNSAMNAIAIMQDIASKVSIINDIAFQTNLLALNAAVEAARAGNAGRGFSIVATEVRKLAERSKKAAIDIEKVSKSTIQKSTNAANKLEKLSPEIEKTAVLVSEIATSSLEQINGVSQVNNAMEELNKVVQQNVNNSEQVANYSEELQGLAEQLNEIISYYITSHTESKLTEEVLSKNKSNANDMVKTHDSKNTNKIEKNTGNVFPSKGFHLNLNQAEKEDTEFEKF